MSARILDGKKLSETLRSQLAHEVAEFQSRHALAPGLAVVLVGDNPASEVYVRNKQAACRKAGIVSTLHRLRADAGEAELVELVARLNADAAVHGILVQLPLPRAIAEHRVLASVDPTKDVDGFHPINAGLLALGRARFVPCTPLGIRALLQHAEVPIRGARVVVLGRSNVVGKPMALLLLEKGEGGDATVTVAHTATRDPASLTREADILIAAAGQPELVTADWIKAGAVVVDVGIHKRADGSLCGDVAFAEVAAKAGAISPVPGGVGPMTIAMLLQNTLLAARLRVGDSMV